MLKKKLICLTLALLLMLGIAIPVFGLGYENVMHGVGLFDVSVQSNFTANRPASGDWNTAKGKIIQRCYVRLTQGSYDSGWCYSSYKPATGNAMVSSPKLSKSRITFNSTSCFYGWQYQYLLQTMFIIRCKPCASRHGMKMA